MNRCRLTLIYYCVLISNLMIVYSTTTDKSYKICYGDETRSLEFSCSKNEMIEIEESFFGVHVNTTNRSCSSKPEDCTTRGGPMRGIVHTCSGLQNCTDENSLAENSTWNVECYNKEIPVASYFKINYTCVSDDAVMNICSDTESNRSEGYISSPLYPKLSAAYNDCSCEFTKLHNHNMTMYLVHSDISETRFKNVYIIMNKFTAPVSSIREYNTYLYSTQSRHVILKVKTDKEISSKFWIKYANSAQVRCGRLHSSTASTTSSTVAVPVSSNDVTLTAIFTPPSARSNPADGDGDTSTHATPGGSNNSPQPTLDGSSSTDSPSGGSSSPTVSSPVGRSSTELTPDGSSRPTPSIPSDNSNARSLATTVSGGYLQTVSEGTDRAIEAETGDFDRSTAASTVSYRPASRISSTDVTESMEDNTSGTVLQPDVDKKKTNTVIVGATVGSVLVLLVMLAAILIVCSQRWNKKSKKGLVTLCTTKYGDNSQMSHQTGSANSQTPYRGLYLLATDTIPQIPLDDITEVSANIDTGQDQECIEGHTNAVFDGVYDSIPDGIYSQVNDANIPTNGLHPPGNANTCSPRPHTCSDSRVHTINDNGLLNVTNRRFTHGGSDEAMAAIMMHSGTERPSTINIEDSYAKPQKRIQRGLPKVASTSFTDHNIQLPTSSKNDDDNPNRDEDIKDNFDDYTVNCSSNSLCTEITLPGGSDLNDSENISPPESVTLRSRGNDTNVTNRIDLNVPSFRCEMHTNSLYGAFASADRGEMLDKSSDWHPLVVNDSTTRPERRSQGPLYEEVKDSNLPHNQDVTYSYGSRDALTNGRQIGSINAQIYSECRDVSTSADISERLMIEI